MTIQTIQEANVILRRYVPLVAQLTGKDATLERIVPLMKLLGDPQDRLRIVHIAGTSGKTSTAYYMSKLLNVSGAKVGLTVSPHVDSITERIQINGQPLPEKEFCEALGIFLDIVHQAAQQPSYFELLYAFALWVFEREGVDYAVVETGMGGLYDSTNVARRSDKVCIITDIGYDHMHILGNTLPEITRQKIGIAHKGNAVLMYGQSEEIMQVVRDWALKKQAILHTTSELHESRTTDLDMIMVPCFQQRNWLLAYYAYRYLAKRDALPHLARQVLQQTLLLQVPGRMDIKKISGKTIVMDGAHNAQKMAAFVQSFQSLYPGTKPAILIALKEGKEYQAVAPLLVPLAGRIIVTTFNTSQDLPARSMDTSRLAATFRAENSRIPVECIEDQRIALKALLDAPERIGIITGSFYLLSQIRKLGA